jgi:hypothetical protein
VGVAWRRQFLVEMWSRPIFELSTRWEDLKRMEERDRAAEVEEPTQRKGKGVAGGSQFASHDMASKVRRGAAQRGRRRRGRVVTGTLWDWDGVHLVCQFG